MKALPDAETETLKRQREEETLGIHGNEPRSNREDRAELRYSSRPPLISFMTTKNWRRICISMQNFSLGLDDVLLQLFAIENSLLLSNLSI